jgi:hypothetical protein
MFLMLGVLVVITIGTTPAFEDILSVLAADIQQLHSQVQLRYERCCASRDIERIALEDIEEVCMGSGSMKFRAADVLVCRPSSGRML